MQKELAVYESICESYKNGPLKTLKVAADALRQALGDLLKPNAQLRNVGSAYETERFHIHTRAKESESLREKLVRTSAGLQLLEVGAKLPGDEARADLHKKLLGFPDALGVKIIGDLDADVDEIVRLIRKKPELELRGEAGRVIWTDLANQPQRMRNGRNIYRIKGQLHYQDESIGVELQVKSKLSDAWSELEHPWFYKNHGYTPVRPVLELGMESVADMLEVLDRFLLKMRELSAKGAEAFETLPFHLWLHRSYGHLLREAFGHDFPLRDLQGLLWHCSVILETMHNRSIEEIKVSVPLSFDEPDPDVPAGWLSMWKTSYHVRTTWAILRTWLDTTDEPTLDLQVAEILHHALGLQADQLGPAGVDPAAASAAYDFIAPELGPHGVQLVLYDANTIGLAGALYDKIIFLAVADSLAIRYGSCLLSFVDPNGDAVRGLFLKHDSPDEKQALRIALENLLDDETAWIDPKAKRISGTEEVKFPQEFRGSAERLIQVLREGERHDQD